MKALANRTLAGILAAATLPGSFLPGAIAGEVKEGPAVQVVTYYANMPAAAVEKTITVRIERGVSQCPAARRVSSRSVDGVSIVRVVCRGGTDPNTALEQIGKLALGTLPTLPPNTLPPVVLPYDPRARPLGMMVVRGSAGLEDLRDTARLKVRNWLGAVKSLVAPVAVGGKDRTVLLHLDPKALESHRVTATDVVVALRQAGVTAAYFGDHSLLIDSGSRSFRELEQQIVGNEGRKAVRIRDVGRVKDESLPQSVHLRIEGRPAVAVPIYCQQGGRPGEVVEGVSETLPALQKRMPRGQELLWVPFGAAAKDRSEDDGLLILSLRAPSSTSLADTERRVAAVERVIQKVIPAGQRQPILAEIGMDQDWSAVYTVNAGPMDATLWVQLSRDRALSAAEYASKLRRALDDDRQFADLAFRFASRDMPPPLDIRITGGKPAEQRKVAEEVRRCLAAVKGAVDVDIAQRTGPVEIDRIDGSRVLDVRANVEGRRRGDVAEDVRQVLRELKVPEGVKARLAE